ncbi:MAG: MBL fold metallo-hydrolase [Ardenticatenaceae bacterium]|nr:MBL fold metallo-hydrolase [Ardenticatenaceae bacterium]MCB8974879.1 MBL fold metallo-hydrolase [Ardenticatenaceae bacterium]
MSNSVLTFTQISPHVWILPRHPDKNRVQATIGVIIAGDQTILIDAGNSLHLARQIQATLAAMDAPPISHVVYTHHHWDHTFGACVYRVPAIAHHLSFQFLSDMRQLNVGEAHLRTKVERNPKLILEWTAEDWAEFEIVLPEITYEDQVQFQFGDVTLELLHVGGIHAADSTVIKVVQDGVMFLGDCYYPAPRYIDTDDQMLDMTMLANLLDENYEHYIDGHNAPMQTRHVRRILRSQALLDRLNKTLS